MYYTLDSLYKDLQISISRLIPEKWESIYLYASVIPGRNGEMYFYYYPKKVLKHNPINCYEIVSKFGLNEYQYNEALDKLYEKIKMLNSFARRKWTNLTISFENDTFSVEYHFDNISRSMYTDEQRRLIWSYRFLKRPLNTLSKEDVALIQNYKEVAPIKPILYTSKIIKEVQNKNIS